jgi:hypothetical protein
MELVSAKIDYLLGWIVPPINSSNNPPNKQFAARSLCSMRHEKSIRSKRNTQRTHKQELTGVSQSLNRLGGGRS